jgi:hypothetical protein
MKNPIIEPPKKPPDYFKGVKVPIKHILKHPNINSPKITEMAIKCNKIVIHTLMFIKLYLLDYYDKNKSLPVVDKVFINSCMKILCNESSSGRPPKKEIKELKDKLTQFYEKEYKPLTQNDQLDYTYMNTVLDYLTMDVLTMYENNIKLHYVDYLERYVNTVWKKDFMIEKIRKIKKTKKDRETTIRQLCNQLRRIKKDLLNVEDNNYKSDPSYHKWITNEKKHILPNKTKYTKDNLYYDLQCSPQDYWSSMVYMMKRLEKDEVTVNNVFPMRSEIIAKHIRLDTTTLVHALMTKKQGNKSDYLFEGNLKRNEDKIWEFFFRTERQCFKKPDYTFHHMIETDGVSCTILLIRNDLIGKRVPSKKVKNGEEYIDELTDYSKLQNKKIVAVDPNLSDLLYCVDGDTKERKFFRYTQDQRRKETKLKKYRDLILEFKKEKIDGKTVIEWETELSKFNRKTLDINEFKKYIKKKNEINDKLCEFYKKYIFRKLKLNGYMNRLKSEQNMIRRFKKIFGEPKDTIIAIGDFQQKQHRKFKEPIKGRGFRTLFRKHGYLVYLVDEFRTSCKCSNCEDENGDCIKFRKGRNPKPNKNDLILKHGVLICKKCNALWNRDENSSRNIYKIAFNAINKKDRPTYLCRSKKEEDDKELTKKTINKKPKKTTSKITTKSKTTKKVMNKKVVKTALAVVSSTSSVGKLQCHL